MGLSVFFRLCHTRRTSPRIKKDKKKEKKRKGDDGKDKAGQGVGT